MNVVPMSNARDWKYFDKRLTELRVNDVANIIERGRVLIEAKDELVHGSWEATVTRHFSMDTAQRLMKITRHPILSNTAHARLLPPSWMTLYELTKLPDDVLLAKLKDGSINPKMERSDARALQDGQNDQTKLIEAIKAEPLANQREAAKKLGVSIGLYQRTRNRLIQAGEIGKPKAEPPQIQTGSRDEMRRAYAAYLKTLSIDEQIEEIRKLIYRGELDWGTDEIGKFLSRGTTITFKR
jgi:hypothetical protein